MAWNVRVQDENGVAVSGGDAVIEFELIDNGRGFKLLHYVDRYGDTYFNGIQMPDFLADWDTLRPASAEQQQWAAVRNMAIRCQSEPHLYLRFIGD